MNFLRNLFTSDEEEPEEEEAPDENTPCNVSGHDWKRSRSPSYFSHGKLGRAERFEIIKKKYQECTKCGRFNTERTTIDEVEVDRQTDTVSVVR